MKFLRAIALALLLLAPLPAVAQQSSPGWTFGYVPTPAEWSFWFGKKVDWQGAAYCPVSGCTFTGPLLTAPSTALGAGINIGQGVPPTSPVNGDIWITASGFFVRFNGATVQLSTPGSAFLVTSNSPNALAVGPNGLTNPMFNVDDSVASAANGVNIQGTAGGSNVNVSVISSVTNDGMVLAAKGTGTIGITTQLFTVGANGSVNPALSVFGGPSLATGASIIGNAAGAGVAITASSSGSNEAISINAKGAANVIINGTCAFGNAASSLISCPSTINGGPVLSLANSASDAASSSLGFGKTRGGGNTLASDVLGAVFFQGFANASNQTVSTYKVTQSGASSGNFIPTRTEFANSNTAAFGNQILRFDQNAHLGIVGQATAPTLTAGCNGAGSSVTGSGSTNDTHGTVTGQTAAATTCTLTFGTAFGAAPDCTFSGFQSPITAVNSVAVGTFQVTFASTANFKFSYHCNGA